MGFEIKDTGWAKILAEVAKLGTMGVRVGVVGSKATESYEGRDITVGEVALINEYGSGDIPERPFVRSTFRGNPPVVRKIEGMLARAMPSVLLGMRSARDVFKEIGQAGADAVKATVLDGAGVPPPNAPSTILKKGSDHPLVDSHVLADAITYRIVDDVTESDSGSPYESYEVT